MKNVKLKFAIIVLILLNFNFCRENSEMENVSKIISDIEQKYAADKRTSIFNVSVSNAGSSIILSGETNSNEAVDELLNHLDKMDLKLENNIYILPDEELGDKIYGIINISVANIRSKPQHPKELATQSLLGTCINVLKEENDWYLIQTPDLYISWVDDDGIQLVNEHEQNLWKSANKVIITEQYSYVYSDSDESSPKVSDLVAGDLLKFIQKGENYTKIEFPDGRSGYVKNSHSTSFKDWTKSVECDSINILKTASQFMGLPYLWGGTSPKGFDCSGFTKTVYYLNGVILPRDASQQVHIGELLSIDENFQGLEKGDLLFFGSRATDQAKEKITHVAIYIGDSKYIHAAGRVRINSLNSKHEDFNQSRVDTFIRAKRIIGKHDNGENLIRNNNFYNH